VLKLYLAVIHGVFRVDARVINRREARFNRHASVEQDYGRLYITL